MLQMTQSGSSVSRALVYRWHRCFTDDPSTLYGANGGGRPKSVAESLKSEVFNALREDTRLNIRDIAVQFDIGYATAHSAHWIPRLLTYNDRQRRVSGISQEMEGRW